MAQKDEKFIQKTRKFQPILLAVTFLLMVLSFVLSFFIQNNFYNGSIVEVENGIKKHEMIKVDTEFESDLKEIILKLSRGYKQTTWLLSVLLGFIVGVVCFVSSIHLFILWFTHKKYLKIIDSGGN